MNAIIFARIFITPAAGLTADLAGVIATVVVCSLVLAYGPGRHLGSPGAM